MIQSIATIAGAIGAICGLLALLYKHYWSPKAKRRRKAVTEGHKAVDEGSVSSITLFFDKLRRRTLLIVLLFMLAGCSPPAVKLHPITPLDIFSIPKGTKIILPNDPNFATLKEGYFLSNFYLKEIMEAKVTD